MINNFQEKTNFNKINQNVLFQLLLVSTPATAKGLNFSNYPIAIFHLFQSLRAGGNRRIPSQAKVQDINTKNIQKNTKNIQKRISSKKYLPCCLQVALTAPIFWHHSFAFVA